MMEAIRDNERVSVCGCNSSGKDFINGRIVLWWMTINYPAKVIVTGPTFTQVDSIVWNETRHAYNNAIASFRGKMYPGSPRYQLNENHFAMGISTDKEFNLQGFHSPNLLVIVTEAHAVPQAKIDELRRLNPKCFIMTGNPFCVGGAFYDAFHSERHLYKTINISAFDTPNLIEGKTVIPGLVTKEDVQRHKDEWGEDSPLYKGTVLGEFPDNLQSAVVPLMAVQAAAERELPENTNLRGPIIVTCDVARHGADKTVVFLRQGKAAKIVWRVQGKDTMEIAGFLIRFCRKVEADYLVIDDVGVGGGVVDRIKELKREGDIENTFLMPFHGGNRANDPELYANQNTEVWWEMRKWFIDDEPVIENDPALMGQCSSRTYTYTSKGSLRIDSKETMAKSPDEADALAMSFAVKNYRGPAESIPDDQSVSRSVWNINKPMAEGSGIGMGLSDISNSKWSI